MEFRTIKRNTILFVAFLLLCGVLHFNERYDHPILPDTVVFCTVFAIYATLILFWMQTVRDRLIRSRSRNYTLSAGGLMMLYLLTRTLKYRIVNTTMLTRYLWYINYVPLILIPTLFLMACIRFHLAEDSPGKERLLLIPAGVLAVVVLSNDLHFLAFRPKVELSVLVGDTGTYSYGMVYFLTYAWIGITIASGVVLLLIKAQQLRDWRKTIPPLFFLALIPALTALNNSMRANGFYRIYEAPEINIFCMLGVFEACIRSRLMPRNENYPGFFAVMDTASVITDREFKPVYRTDLPLKATPDQMQASLERPQEPDEDTRLFGRNLQVGHAFWNVDDSVLHQLNNRLEEANETIGLENKLIQYENEQREERARLKARNAVYAKAAQELYPVQKQIAAMLEEMEPGTPEFRPKLAKVCVYNAFVKRKTNLILTYSETDRIDGKELYLAIREMAVFLNECGVTASVDRGKAESYSYADTLALYDSFLLITEAVLPRISRMLVFLQETGFRMVLNCEMPEDMLLTPCPVSAEKTDDLLYLTVSAKGGRT